MADYFKLDLLMLHSSGLLNLYGCCADDPLEVDDLGVDDSLDDDLEGVFDDSQSLEDLAQEVDQADLMLEQQKT